jgi:hypothetical protein
MHFRRSRISRNRSSTGPAAGNNGSAGSPRPEGPGSTGTREQYDAEEGYCRALGHYVRFGYCRTGTGTLPCAQIADCWFERIPIAVFLGRHYSRQELGRIFAPRPGKIETIIDILRRLDDRPPPS